MHEEVWTGLECLKGHKLMVCLLPLPVPGHRHQVPGTPRDEGAYCAEASPVRCSGTYNECKPSQVQGRLGPLLSPKTALSDAGETLVLVLLIYGIVLDVSFHRIDQSWWVEGWMGSVANLAQVCDSSHPFTLYSYWSIFVLVPVKSTHHGSN